MLEGCSVLGFKTTYKQLDLKMLKEEPIKYEALLLGLALNEFKRGFKVKRTCKATKKGTSVTYEAIKSQEEAEAVCKAINDKDKELCERLKQEQATK